MNQRKASARYYLFEDLLWEAPAFAHLARLRSIADLQILAGLVWAREGGCGKCPVVEQLDSGDTSHYCFQARAVRLVRKHRGAGGLLHELAHALGYWDKLTHGPAFRARCMRLYKMYGDWDGRIDWGDDAAHKGRRKR